MSLVTTFNESTLVNVVGMIADILGQVIKKKKRHINGHLRGTNPLGDLDFFLKRL